MRSSVLGPASHGHGGSGTQSRPERVAGPAGGGDGADADRFMAHIKKGLQEFDESAL
jgi:hypothetical protein